MAEADQRFVLLAAGQSAACAADLIETLRERDDIDFDNGIGLLCDAIVGLGEVTDSLDRDGQLVAAANKWIGENR